MFQNNLDEKMFVKQKLAFGGLKISPKRWNERIAGVGTKIGLTSNYDKPCLFTRELEINFSYFYYTQSIC